MNNFKGFINILWGWSILWETNFKMWNHRSNLIKYVPNIFNLYFLADIPTAYTDLDRIFPMFSLMALDFIKRDLYFYVILSIDRNDPHILLCFFWKLMTTWRIWDCINDIRNCENFHHPIYHNQFSFQKEVTQFHIW